MRSCDQHRSSNKPGLRHSHFAHWMNYLLTESATLPTTFWSFSTYNFFLLLHLLRSFSLSPLHSFALSHTHTYTLFLCTFTVFVLSLIQLDKRILLQGVCVCVLSFYRLMLFVRNISLKWASAMHSICTFSWLHHVRCRNILQFFFFYQIVFEKYQQPNTVNSKWNFSLHSCVSTIYYVRTIVHSDSLKRCNSFEWFSWNVWQFDTFERDRRTVLERVFVIILQLAS